MRKIVFGWDANICGVGGFSDADEFEDDISDNELYEIAWDYAVNNAEAYGIYPESWRLDDEEGDEDSYPEIGSYWEDYDPKKHDQLKPGGGKWF